MRNVVENFIKFNCIDCGMKVKTPTENIGKKGICPKCKTSRIIVKKEEYDFKFDIEKDLEEINKNWRAKNEKSALGDDFDYNLEISDDVLAQFEVLYEKDEKDKNEI